jgi:GxxExxY protein
MTIQARIRRVSQAEFGELAYSVMGCVFEIHQELGRFFHEKIYKRELAHRHPDVQLEVPIEVRYKSFSKTYLLAVLVAGGGLFEFKAVEAIVPRHRAQSLNYLLLAELSHGKLINVRPEQVEHEFVNTTLTREDRLRFQMASERWNDRTLGGSRFREVLTALLRDWGTGLELPLYEEVLTHLLGGEARVLTDVEVRMPDHTLGHQKMRLAAPRTAFTLTALGQPSPNFETHARRLLCHADLDAILWADLGLKCVTFTTIS